MNTKKNSAKLIITVSVCMLLCIIVSAAVLIFTEKDTASSPDRINVIDSGMLNSSSDDFYGKIISYDLDGEYPYIEVEWFNNTGTGYTAGEEFYIHSVTDNKLVDCRRNPDEYAWNEIAYVFSACDSLKMTYYIGDMDIEKDSTYLLHTEIFMDSASSLKSTLWLEFRTGDLTDETMIINNTGRDNFEY